MANKIYTGVKVSINGLDKTHFSSDGLQVLLIEEVINAVGFGNAID